MNHKKQKYNKKELTAIIVGIYIIVLLLGVFFSGTFLIGCDGCDSCENCSMCDGCDSCSSCNKSEKSEGSSSSKTAS
jgi:flagellar basal body-associated protein FliL